MTRTLYFIMGLSIGSTLGFIAGHRYFLYHREKYIIFMREHIRFLRERLEKRDAQPPR